MRLFFSIIAIATFCFSCKTTKIDRGPEPTKPEATEFWEPVPELVNPGNTTIDPPSDAIVLFDGKSLDEWQHLDEKSASWNLGQGAMTVKAGAGEIMTKKKFGDCQLHIEWRTPANVVGESQGRGNSGIFLMGKYEVQVLDNYQNPTYSNGQAGSIYKQTRPLVNACKAPGVWQTYDIIFKAPKFDAAGKKTESAYVTVLHNGVLVQNNTMIQGSTEYIGWPKNVAHGNGSLHLQDHGNPVSYRNIWIRNL